MHCRKDKSGLFFHSSRPDYREQTVLYAARGAVLRVNRPPHLGLTPGHPSPTLPCDLNLRAPPARPRKTQSTELSRADSNSIASRVGGFLIEWSVIYYGPVVEDLLFFFFAAGKYCPILMNTGIVVIYKQNRVYLIYHLSKPRMFLNP